MTDQTSSPAVRVPPRHLAVTVTSLEMRDRPDRPLSVPAGRDVMILRAHRPTVAFYRFLYNTVGEDWLWGDRRRLSDAALDAILADPKVRVHVLYSAGTPCGYFELDLRQPGDVELAYFGLMPGFIGGGLGRHLMEQALEQAWSHDPHRVWVHTCTFDHPAALGFYQAAGFVPFDTRHEVVVDPRREGLIPLDKAPHVPLAEA